MKSSSSYAGASAVATTLWVLGWIIALAGFIAGVASAGIADPCEDFDVCGEGEGLVRLGMFVGPLVVAWLIAVWILWSAYVLRLLSDIERRLRGGG